MESIVTLEDIATPTVSPPAPTRPGDAPADGTDPQAVRRALQAFLDHRCRTSPAVRAVVSRVVGTDACESADAHPLDDVHASTATGAARPSPPEA